MSQPEATQHFDEITHTAESVTSAPLLDPTTVTTPADQGLNLSAEFPEIPTKKTRTRQTTTMPVKEFRPGFFNRLRSRKARILLTLASLLLIVGLMVNANRLPVIADADADSQELDLSEIGDVSGNGGPSERFVEPQRHEFDPPFDDHPLMRNATQTRLASGWSTESDRPATDSGSVIVPSASFIENPLPETSRQQRRTPVPGTQGAWLTGQIEADDLPESPASVRTSSANQSVPRLLRNGTRHPLVD